MPRDVLGGNALWIDLAGGHIPAPASTCQAGIARILRQASR